MKIRKIRCLVLHVWALSFFACLLGSTEGLANPWGKFLKANEIKNFISTTANRPLLPASQLSVSSFSSVPLATNYLASSTSQYSSNSYSAISMPDFQTRTFFTYIRNKFFSNVEKESSLDNKNIDLETKTDIQNEIKNDMKREDEEKVGRVSGPLLFDKVEGYSSKTTRDEVLKLIQAGANIHYKDYDRCDRLRGYRREKDSSIIPAYYQDRRRPQRPDPYLGDGVIMTVLANAVWSDDPELLQILIDHGADVNEQPSKHGGLALSIAAMNRRLNSVRTLLANGAHPDGMRIFDPSEPTPLEYAVLYTENFSYYDSTENWVGTHLIHAGASKRSINLAIYQARLWGHTQAEKMIYEAIESRYKNLKARKND